MKRPIAIELMLKYQFYVLGLADPYPPLKHYLIQSLRGLIRLVTFNRQWNYKKKAWARIEV